jgi:misacylated tRNA(Ala) deacylase
VILLQRKLHLKIHPGTNPKPFDTEIIDIKNDSLIFSKSYCFPRGGGQPGDIGIVSSKIHESELLETFHQEFIMHPVKDPDLFNIGDHISCSINTEVRNRNSMMHTTQHIVSALADELFNAETVGNQISQNHTRLDLLFADRDKFNISDLESAFNEVLHKNSSVKIHEWDRNTILNHENMRNTKFMNRIPESIKKLRVVEIEDIDLCPCGGTHVESIGILNKLKVLNVKSKGAGKLRITY